MSSIVNIPFNFQPVGSPSRKTASYTIPAGRYAKVELSFFAPRISSFTLTNITNNVTLGGPNWITINGSNILQEKEQIFYTNWSYNVDMNMFVNFPSTYTSLVEVSFQVFSLLNSNPTLSFGSIVSTTVQGGRMYAGGNTATIVTNGSGNTPRTGSGYLLFYLKNYAMPDTITVWLKAGDVINATGGNWQAMVTEFTAPV